MAIPTQPTLESLKQELERQDRELEELMECLAMIDPRDVPQAFFNDFEEACEPQLAWAVPANDFNPFGLRA